MACDLYSVAHLVHCQMDGTYEEQEDDLARLVQETISLVFHFLEWKPTIAQLGHQK